MHPAEVADAGAGLAETPDTVLTCVRIIFAGAKMLRFRAARQYAPQLHAMRIIHIEPGRSNEFLGAYNRRSI